MDLYFAEKLAYEWRTATRKFEFASKDEASLDSAVSLRRAKQLLYIPQAVGIWLFIY